MNRRIAQCGLMFLFVVLVLGTAPTFAAVFTSSGSGNWSNSATWGGAGVPGAGDTATINSGHTVTLDVPVTVQNVTVNNGTLTGTQSLNVTSGFTLAGTHSGAGTTTIPFGATMTVTGGSTLDARTLNVAGTLNINAANYIYLQNGASLSNSGTVDFLGDGALYFNTGGGTISNSGTIRKSGGTGNSYIQLPLTATSGSQFLVQSGTFHMAQAVTATSATFSTSASAILLFDSNHTRTFDAGSTIDGPGTVNWNQGTNTVSGTYNVTGATTNSGATTTIGGTITSLGTLTVSGGTLTLNSASTLNLATLNMQGGTLTGTAPITLTGATQTWTAGTIAGTGLFTIPSGTTVNFNGYVYFDTRAFSNAGTMTYSGNYYSYFYNSATLSNSGTVTFQGDGGFYVGSGTPTVTNSGTIQKTGGIGAGYIQPALTAQSGSQQLAQSGTFGFGAITATGATFSVSSGATLQFYYNNTRTFDSASSISGAGTVDFNAGTNTVNAAYNVTGTTKNGGAATTVGTNNITATGNLVVTSGSLALTNATAPAIGNITAQGGTLTLNIPATLSIATLNMTGGTLNGTAGISLTGASQTWTGGTIATAGGLTIPSGTTVALNGYVYFDTLAVSNAGTMTYSSNYYSYFYNSATLNNSGTVTFQGDGGFYIGSGTPSITNSGTIQKTGGTGFGAMQVALTAQSGSQQLAQSGTFGFGAIAATGATFSVSSGAILALSYSNTRTFDSASTISGAGNVEFNNGTNTVNATFNVTGTTKSSAGTTGIGTNNITSVGNILVTGGALTLTNSTAPTIGTITVQGGTLTLNIPVTLSIATFTMNGGTINGTASISITGASQTWTGGTIGIGGALTIPVGTTVNFNGYVYFDAVAISNAGTMLYSSTAYYSYFYNSATLNNSGTVTFQGDNGFYIGSGTPSVTNSGTIQKTGGTSNGGLQVALTAQSGSQVSVQSGTLLLGNITSTGATLSVSAGATAQFYYTSTSSFDAASTISGAGTVFFSAGTNTSNGTYNITGLTKSSGGTNTINSITSVGDLFLNGGTLTLNNGVALSVGTLTMQGGTLDGTAPINLTGTSMTWTAGTIGGSGLLSIPGGTTITNTGITFDARPVSNAGTINITGGGTMTLRNNAVLTNSGTFDIQADGNVYLSGTAGTTAIVNNGTIKKSGGASGSTVNVALTLQSGSQLLAQAAILYLGNVTSTGGTLNVTAGATVVFYYTSTSSFDAASTISGGGTVQWNAGTNAVSATYNVTGATNSGGGTTTIGTNITSTGAITMTSGTLTLNNASAISVPTLTMQGGTLNGTAPINLTGAAMTWSGGIIGGSGAFSIPGGTTITIAGGVTFDARPVTNGGTITFTSTNYFYMQNNAVLTNNNTITLPNDNAIYLSGAAGTTAVVNNGTIQKTGGTGSSTFNVPLTANGGSQFLIQSGNVYFGNITSTGATLAFSGGATATLYYTTTATFDAASTISGAGTLINQAGTNSIAGTISSSLRVSGGTLSINNASAQSIPTLTMQGGTLNGTAPINLTGAAMTWSGGVIGGSGAISSPAGTTITIAGGVTIDARPVTNGGTITFTTTNYFYMQNNAVLTNNGTITFPNDNAIYLSGAAGTTAVVNNGTIQKTGGTGSSTFNVKLTANGGSQFLIQSGNVYFGNITSTGATLAFSGGATATFNYTTTATFDAASTISGAGTFINQAGTNSIAGTISSSLSVSGGTLSINSASAQSIPTLTMQGGTLNGTAPINLTGAAMTWSGGVIGGSGALSSSAGTTITIAGGVTIDARPVTNGGTITYTTTNYFYMQNNAVLTNNGTITFPNDNAIYLSGAAGTTAVVNNGTIQKTGGTGSSTFNVPLTANGGSQFLIQSGNIYFGNITSTGATLAFSGGATATLNYTTTATFDAASTISGTGTFINQAGTNSIAGTISSSLSISGGTLSINSASAQSIPTLTMQGGALNGTANINLTGATMTWSGGIIGGSGTLSSPGGTTITIAGGVTIDARPVTNGGTITYTSTNYFYLQNNAVLTNNGTITFPNDNAIYLSGAAGSTAIVNNGLVRKTGGTGTSNIYTPFTNAAAGTIEVSTGTLYFNIAPTLNGTLSFLASSATVFGKVSVSGALALGGILSATTTGGYTPPNGTTFQVLTYGSKSGAFGTKFLSYTAGSFTDSYTATAMTLTAGPSSCFSAPSNIISWYKGEGTTNDSLGPNNATNNGATFVSGKVGQALSFNGSSAYINAPDDPSLRPSALTIEGWVNFSSVPANGHIFAKAVGTGTNDSYALWYESGALRAAVGNTSSMAPVAYTFTPATGTWYHVAFTFNGTNEVLYVNGASVATASTGVVIGHDGHGLKLGAESDSEVVQFFFPGALDEMTLYSRALSAAEVTAIYNADANGKCYVPPAAPTISSFSPTQGPTAGGTSVTVNGTGLDSVSSITFGGTPATVTARAFGTLTVTTPAHVAGAVTISVTSPGGSANSASSFTYIDGPTVSSFSPLFGPPGTSVAITGASFTTASAVAFNGTSASFTVNNDSQITATVPALATTGLISVTNATGTGSSASNFTVTTASNMAFTAINGGVNPVRDVPFSVTVEARTSGGSPTTVYQNTNITLSLATGTGTLGGTLVGTIPAGSSSTTINGLTYTVAESGVSLTATASGGDPLAPATSTAFTVDPSSSVLVTNSLDSGNGSLRNAIALANGGGCSSPCTVNFNIPGGGVHIITLASALPAITAASVTIDATTQPGYAGTPLVQLANGCSCVDGLTISGTSSTIRGLAISGFGGNGIRISGNNHLIQNNTIATNGGNGVVVLGISAAVTGNRILQNSIHDNTGIGIDLSDNGVTANDAGDADTGDNGHQNTPVISFAQASGGTLTATVSVDSSSVSGTGSLRIELFKADSGGEGLTFLGGTCFAGNTLTNQNMTVPSAGLTTGDSIVGTATSYTGAACTTVNEGTSEFSAAYTVLTCTTPSSAITAPLAVCASTGGHTASVPFVAGASYLWSITNGTITGGAGTSSITFTAGASGTVGLQVTVNDSGCNSTGTKSVAINTPAPAAITPGGPTTFCSGGSVTLTANSGAAYLWSTGATTQSIVVSSTGSYSVTVTDAAGCNATSSPVNVTVYPTPVVNITGPTATCSTAPPVTLDAGVFASYSWSTGATTQTINVAPGSTTTYSVTVTDAYGCTGTDTHTVTVTTNPTPSITAPATACASSTNSASATAGASSYLWTISGGTINTGQNTSAITFTANASGNVTLGVTVTYGSCSASSSTTIPITQPPVVTITGPTSACPNEQFILDAGNYTTYQWSTGATSRFLVTTQTSPSVTYSVIVTDANGCSGTDTHTVTLSPGVNATITAPSQVDPSSNNNAASVSAQPGATYNWTITNGTITSGAGTNSILFSAGSSGTIDLGVTVTLGACSASNSAQVSIGTPVPQETDLSVIKTAPASVQAGATFTYTIVVHNDGPLATTAQLTDSLPGGVLVSAIAAGSWTCAPSGSQVNCSGAIAVGENRTILLTVTAPLQAGTITNNVAVTAPLTDLNSTNNASTATTTVLANVTCPSTPPSLTAPAGNATVASPVTFSWTSVANATGYELWINAALAASTSSTSATVGVPSGSNTWFVVARSGANCDALVSATRTFTVPEANNCALHGAPQVTAPAEGSVGNSNVSIAWTAVPQAIGYRVWIQINGGAAQDIGTTNGATSLNANIPGGQIALFVDALFSACPATRSAAVHFTVTAPDPCAQRGSASPQSPANNSTLNSSAVHFQWLAANPAPSEYRVWASVNGAAAAVLGSTNTTSLDAVIASGDVIWWIEATYPGCASTESQRSRFTIPPAQTCVTATPAELPALLAPANGVTLTNGNVLFQWSGIPNVVGYDVYLAVANGTPVLIGSTNASTTSLSRTVSPGALSWYVVANVDRCPSRSSATAQFTFAPPPACDTNVRPVAGAPLDETSTTSPVSFQWSHPRGATRFEVYVIRGSGVPVLIGTTTANHLDDVNLATGSIRWFVRAFFGSECTPLDSDEQRLEIIAPPAACAALNAPVISALGEISSGIEFLLQWGEVAGATGYQLQIASNGDFTDAEIINTTATSHALIRQNEGGTVLAVYARVRAVDSRCTPLPTVSAYGPTAAIFVLPQRGVTASVPLSDPTLVHYAINLGSELAGQSFTATPTEPWLTVTPSSGVVASGGTSLDVVADTALLGVGTHSGALSITLTSPSARIAASGTTTITPTVSVNLVTPVKPALTSTPSPDTMIIPAVANADGINSHFESDVRVANTSPQVIKYQLTFIPSGDAGISAGKQTTFSIDPGRTVALDDVLRSWFGTGTANAIGVLQIRPLTATSSSTQGAPFGPLASLVSFASSRTFNVTPNGTFGQFVPAVPYANFAGTSKVLSLQQIGQSAKTRTNLGLVEGSGNPADVLIKVFGGDGQQITSFTTHLNGGQHTQLNSFLFEKGITLDDGRVEVQVTSSTGKITAYASVLDNETSDGVLVSPVALGTEGNTKWVIPGVADVRSGFADWQSDVRVFNATDQTVDVTASFYSRDGGEPKVKVFTLGPREVRQFDRVLPSLFGVSDDGGALHLSTAKPSNIIATARTYNQTTKGTYGQFVSAVTPVEAVAVGTRPVQLLQIEESSRMRSNIGLAEVNGKPVKVEVTVTPPDAKFAAVVEVDLAANEYRQINSLLAGLGMGDTYNARVSVRALSGEGRAAAFASVIDLATNDPYYVQGQ